MKRPVLPILLVLFAATSASIHAGHAQNSEPDAVALRHYADASELTCHIYNQLPKQDGFNLPTGTEVWSWNVTYQPQYGIIAVKRDQEVLMRPSAVINGNGEARSPQLAHPGFTLLIEPFVSPTEYARLQAENDATRKQLSEMYDQMLHQRISHKFDSFLPKNEEEKKKVDAYNKLKGTTHHLPDYYFRGVSLSWMSYDQLFRRPGETPRSLTIGADEQKGWESEQAQAVQAILKIVSHYEPEAK